MQVIAVSIEEGAKAFRVNGVTFAKRHLAVLFPDTPDLDKALAKYLAIVPILAERRAQGVDDTNGDIEAQRKATHYGAVKATRIFAALNLPDEAVIPFMAICAQQASGEGMTPKQAQPAKASVMDIVNHLKRTLH